METKKSAGSFMAQLYHLPTWWFIPVSGLVHPSYDWRNPTYLLVI